PRQPVPTNEHRFQGRVGIVVEDVIRFRIQNEHLKRIAKQTVDVRSHFHEIQVTGGIDGADYRSERALPSLLKHWQDRGLIVPPLLAQAGKVGPYQLPDAILNERAMMGMNEHRRRKVSSSAGCASGDSQNKIDECLPKRLG